MKIILLTLLISLSSQKIYAFDIISYNEASLASEKAKKLEEKVQELSEKVILLKGENQVLLKRIESIENSIKAKNGSK